MGERHAKRAVRHLRRKTDGDEGQQSLKCESRKIHGGQRGHKMERPTPFLIPRSGQWLALSIGYQDAPGSRERPGAHLSHLGTNG